MDNRKERIQPAVRKETEHVMVYTAAGVAVMCISGIASCDAGESTV